MAASAWKGYLTFGLVSFPVRLVPAARAKSVHFHMLHKKDLSRIKEVWYCTEEDKPVDRDQIVKGYEAGKGEYVVVDEEDMKKIAPPTAETMEIGQFVRAGEVDPIYLEKSYYVQPDEKISKPYALLLAAMSETKYYAIAKVAMHGREHVVVIRPAREGLVLHTMYYADELNKANVKSLDSLAQTNRKEMELAKKLIESLASAFKPEQFHDQYRENVEKMVEAKQQGEKIAPVKRSKTAPVVDILEALQRSLKQPSKAPAKEPSKNRKRGRRAA